MAAPVSDAEFAVRLALPAARKVEVHGPFVATPSQIKALARAVRVMADAMNIIHKEAGE